MPIMDNKPGKRATLLLIANGSFALSDFATPNTSVETVQELTLRSINWTSNGVWTIARGANTLMTLTNDGVWDLAGWGIGVLKDTSANLTITLSSGSTGTILIDVGKKSTVANNLGY